MWELQQKPKINLEYLSNLNDCKILLMLLEPQYTVAFLRLILFHLQEPPIPVPFLIIANILVLFLTEVFGASWSDQLL
jgi:hypothetical protein